MKTLYAKLSVAAVACLFSATANAQINDEIHRRDSVLNYNAERTLVGKEINEYAENLVTTTFFYGLNTESGDFVGLSKSIKSEKELEDGTTETTEENYRWENNWLLSNKDVNVLDAQGNELMRGFYQWNADSQEWVLAYKEENEYKNGLKTRSLVYTPYWETDECYLSQITVYVYDEEGKLLSTESNSLNYSTGKPEWGDRTECVYDEEGKLKEEIFSTYDSWNDEWIVNPYNRTYQYDEAGRLILKLRMNNHNGEEVISERTILEYHDNGVVRRERTENWGVHWQTMEYEILNFVEYLYNEDGKWTRCEGTWYGLQTCEYNENGEVDEICRYFNRDEETGEWQPSTKEKHSYPMDLNGGVTIEVSNYAWDSESSAWSVTPTSSDCYFYSEKKSSAVEPILFVPQPSDRAFTLDGRPVNESFNGIIIKNGKKFIRK